jgi:hypothetical protein
MQREMESSIRKMTLDEIRNKLIIEKKRVGFTNSNPSPRSFV